MEQSMEIELKWHAKRKQKQRKWWWFEEKTEKKCQLEMDWNKMIQKTTKPYFLSLPGVPKGHFLKQFGVKIQIKWYPKVERKSVLKKQWEMASRLCQNYNKINQKLVLNPCQTCLQKLWENNRILSFSRTRKHTNHSELLSISRVSLTRWATPKCMRKQWEIIPIRFNFRSEFI